MKNNGDKPSYNEAAKMFDIVDSYLCETHLVGWECDEAVKNIDAGDELEVDFKSGLIKNLTKNQQYQGQGFPEFMQKIIDSDGLIGYIKNS